MTDTRAQVPAGSARCWLGRQQDRGRGTLDVLMDGLRCQRGPAGQVR